MMHGQQNIKNERLLLKRVWHTPAMSVRCFPVASHETEYEHAFPTRDENIIAKLGDTDA